MKHILIAFLAMFSASAFAVLDDNSTNQYQGQAQGQLQGQAQGQGQGQGQAQGLVNVNAPNTRISNDSRAAAVAFTKSNSASSSGGNTMVVNEAAIPADTTQAIQYGGTYTVKGVPNVYGGNVFPTAPCMGSSTIGGAGVGFGISIGSSWTDDECGIRETARSFSGMDMKADALAVLCSSKYAAVAPACMKK
jgi:hypothetical protein